MNGLMSKIIDRLPTTAAGQDDDRSDRQQAAAPGEIALAGGEARLRPRRPRRSRRPCATGSAWLAISRSPARGADGRPARRTPASRACASRRGVGKVTGTSSRTRPGPRRQQQHLLAEERRLVDRVGDEHDRRAGRFPDLQQLLVQPVARDLVERAERLVHQQQPRTARPARGRSPRAGACRPTARADRPVSQPVEADQRRAAPAASARRAAPCRRRPRAAASTFSQHGAPRQQRRRPGRRSRSRGAARAACGASPSTEMRAAASARSGRPSRAARSTCRSPRARAASGSCRAGSSRSMSSSAVTVPRSVVKRTLTRSQETAVSAKGGFAHRIAGDAGVPHDARLGHVERRRLVHQAAIVPDHRVAGAPVVVVDARRLAGEVDQLLRGSARDSRPARPGMSWAWRPISSDLRPVSGWILTSGRSGILVARNRSRGTRRSPFFGDVAERPWL